MAKNRLKGLIKTKHFIQRQKERDVSDLDIIKAIKEGLIKENDIGHHYILGELTVTIDYHQEVLITVHPGGPAMKLGKVLGPDKAREIKALIEHKERLKDQMEEEKDHFSEYVRENKVKKLKK